MHLIRSRILFCFRCLLNLCIVYCILTRSSRCCNYIFCCICGCIGTFVMLSQFHPHNVHVSTCTLCLVGDLKSLLCGFWRERLNLHSTDFRASQSGIRALVSISLLFRYDWLSKKRVHKSCRITSLTVVVSRVSKVFD